MKQQIRGHLLRARLWYPFDFLRKLPAILRWFTSGCSGVAPHPVKMMIVRSYVKRYALSEFVETGTYRGDTLGYLANTGIRCTSIELSDELYELACKRFARYRNVRLIHGDSGKRLSEVLERIKAPALFWLDGHYSSGLTARADAHTPVSAELRAILDHPVKGHVILIDDARCFDGTADYPHLDDLLRVVRDDGRYSAEVSTDIIRLISRSGR